VCDAGITGTVKVYVRNTLGQDTNWVFNAADVTAAGTEFTANRYFQTAGGNAEYEMEFNPSTTWFRSSTTTGGYSLFMLFVW
jgi:hypothetical protein